jgi:hypothetical protein
MSLQGQPKWLVVALFLVAAVMLGATVFREPVAYAAQILDAKVVAPLDGDGNIRVHEQGTAAVDVANPSIAVRPEGEPITVKLSTFGGGGGTPTYVVPADKRLLIRYVNGLIDANLDDFLRLHVTGTPPTHDYAFAGFAAGGVLVISEPVTISAIGGQHVVLGIIDAKVELSGYLLDA